MRPSIPKKPPLRGNDKSQLRINDAIKAMRVRVLDAHGEMLGVISREEALARAAQENLDLVEVSPFAEPPVCKILDYGKFRYQQQKKKSEARRKQKVTLVKEIKLRPGIDRHDFDVKKRAAERFLDAGDKIKLTVRFRGRELSRRDLGEQILNKLTESLEGKIKIESPPQNEGRQMCMVIAPHKS